jgi:hypothetical protein
MNELKMTMATSENTLVTSSAPMGLATCLRQSSCNRDAEIDRSASINSKRFKDWGAMRQIWRHDIPDIVKCTMLKASVYSFK